MKLNVRAAAIACAILWGGATFLVAAAHRMWPGYGNTFLEMLSSLYPGYHVGGLRTGLIGTAYAAVDGAVCGTIFAWLYNRMTTKAGGGPAT